MQLRHLGWAGIELEHEDETLVIDPLQDAAAVFAPLGEAARDVPLPSLAASAPGRAAGALVTHLHRDHADAAALDAALRPDAPVFEPPRGDADDSARLALLQADGELTASGRERRQLAPWERASAGPFTITALPAVDGTGDPQVSWLVEAGGRRVVHLGDTMFHGAWWAIARLAGTIDVACVPVNGAVVRFPHRRPASPYPAVLDAAQAATAAHLLGARTAVAIHHGAYALRGVYAPREHAGAAFAAAAERLGVHALVPRAGDVVDIDADPGAAAA